MSIKTKKTGGDKPSPDTKPFSRGHLFFILAIVVTGLACYFQTLDNPLLTAWDDQVYVTQNTAIRAFTWENLRTIFSKFYLGNYAPIHILSYSLDYAIWELNPLGYHLTNLMFHLGNGLLIYFLIIRLGHSHWTAGFTALFFILHPVQVESVTWVTERKNVLSMFFLLGSLQGYIRFREKRDSLHYWASLAFFVLALLTKAVVVTLPLILFLYDRCYLRDKNWTRDLLSKLPYLLLAGAMVLITIRSQEGVIVDYHGGGALSTLFTSIYVHMLYLRSSLLPYSLSIIHDVPILTSMADPRFLVSFSLLLLTAWTVALLLKKEQPKMVFWIAWFFVTLLPVSHIIPIEVLMQDRYLYMPLVGVGFVLGSAVMEPRETLFKSSSARMVLAGMILAGFGLITVERNKIWETEAGIWKEAVAHSPNHHTARNKLANAYLAQENYTASLDEYQKAIELKPGFAKAHYNQGRAYYFLNDLDRAKAKFLDTLRVQPNYAEAHYNLGLVYKDEGDLQVAVESFRKATQYDRRHSNAYAQIGEIAIARQDYNQAEQALGKAVALNPMHESATFNLALTYTFLKNPDYAVNAYKGVLHMNPNNYLAHGNLGTLYLDYLQNKKLALHHFERCLALKPDQAQSGQLKRMINKVKKEVH